MAKIVNSIIINANFDRVFDITNDIDNWVNLFTEYKESRVIKRAPNYLLFRLTTHTNKNGKSYSWISERYIDKKNKKIVAKRLDPLFPFKFMHIEWFYKDVEGGTEMKWVQEFDVDPASGFSDEIVINHLNETSKEQLKAIKNNIEKVNSSDC